MQLIKKPFLFVLFVIFFLRKLVEANLFIAKDLLTPGLLIHPAYIKVPLILHREVGILMLTNLISMTPGSLTVDVEIADREILVHSMYAENPDKVVEEINEFQVRIKKIFE